MMAQQAALLQKAAASLQAAKLLASQEFYDFAISRAYYTMFYVAEAFLLGEGLTFSKHASVIAAFGQHFAKTGHVPPEFHHYLIKAQDSRLISDYDPSTKLTEEHASVQIERAEKFLELAERLIGPVLPAD
jgi:uncharacterized protein (UPF0332 family)